MDKDLLGTFIECLPHNGRLVGLDVGMAAIGIALSDTERMIATPHSTLIRENISKDTGRLRTIIKEHNVGGVVVGLPMHMDGSEGSSCVMVREFADKLIKKIPVPIYFQDERLSTSAVTRTLQEMEFTRKKRDTLDDKLAASYILQNVLDAINYRGQRSL